MERFLPDILPHWSHDDQENRCVRIQSVDPSADLRLSSRQREEGRQPWRYGSFSSTAWGSSHPLRAGVCCLFGSRDGMPSFWPRDERLLEDVVGSLVINSGRRFIGSSMAIMTLGQASMTSEWFLHEPIVLTIVIRHLRFIGAKLAHFLTDFLVQNAEDVPARSEAASRSTEFPGRDPSQRHLPPQHMAT